MVWSFEGLKEFFDFQFKICEQIIFISEHYIDEIPECSCSGYKNCPYSDYKCCIDSFSKEDKLLLYHECQKHTGYMKFKNMSTSKTSDQLPTYFNF